MTNDSGTPEFAPRTCATQSAGDCAGAGVVSIGRGTGGSWNGDVNGAVNGDWNGAVNGEVNGTPCGVDNDDETGGGKWRRLPPPKP